MTDAVPAEAEQAYRAGNAHYLAGRLGEAETMYRQALAIEPAMAKVYSNLGILDAGLERLDRAVSALRRALQIEPSMPDIRINLGIVLNKIVGQRSGRAIGEQPHYEALPFPPRDPEAELYCLKVSNPDILAKINQYCFAGSRDFSQPFRVLAAGCGTGDSVIWLSHQLRGTPAEIVAIDLSEASLAVAAARAQRRGLDNIRWVHGSLLDVAELGIGKFDYITCLGVLHHLPDPVAGLRALESVLAEGGAMAIMVYGAVGRSHIYSMQNLLRRVTAGLERPADKLSFARQIVANLPARNDFRQREGAEMIAGAYLNDDTNFWDTLLHSQDRAYTVSQFRDYLASAGLHVQGFISYAGNAATTALQYDLDFLVGAPSHSERLRSLTLADREDAAELLDGSLALHTVYASRSPNAGLDPTAPDAILSPMSELARKIIGHLKETEDGITIALRNGSSLLYRPSSQTREFLSLIDGQRTNAAIAGLLGIELASIRTDLRIPAVLHWVTARRAQGTPLAPLPDRGTLSFPLLHGEPSVLPL